ncbi:TPA: hypothetical protein NKQ51_004444 [Vibrio parahaemolyticus]|nr:hypothetical protein [Vibrio parahaemolyticus]HCH1629612.1 hypothetical protein [Vibrio parahaemolyticus]
MSFANVIAQTDVIIGSIVSMAGLLVIYHNVRNIKGEKAKELHGRYVQVKELASDIESNYPEILIILSGITRADLSIAEVRWFISEPRAFLKLETYGKLPRRYSKIDLEKGEFSLTERVDSFKKRMLERFNIIAFSLGILSLISALWYLILLNIDSKISGYIAFGFWFIYLLSLGWAVNYMLTALNNSLKLVGKP